MNMHSITIKDETVGQEILNTFVLTFLESQISVADIIRERVRHEVESYNNRSAERRYTGLVQPSKSEAELNGHKLKKSRKVDVDKQIETALKAFQSNGFFMLIDDVQAENLDDIVTIEDDMNVVFLKVIPLVGG
ncbi:MAG: hypothetical protein ACRBHB_20840 [Arenicella sp.]